MKILLVTLGTDGDIDPFLALGHELKARNHNVVLVSNDYFQTKAEQSGFDFVSIGSEQEYLDVLANPDVWHRFKGFPLLVDKLILSGMHEIYQQIKYLQTPDTVVLAPCFMYGARIARDKLNIPLVTVVLQPTSLWSDDELPMLASYPWAKLLPVFVKRNLAKGLERFYLEPLVKPETNRIRTKLDLPAVDQVSTHWQYSPDLILALFPKWFGPTLQSPPQHLVYTGFVSHENPSAEMPPSCRKFLMDGTPPIAFTAGSGHQHAKKYFEVAVKACQKLNARGILLTKFRSNLPAQLPEFVMHCEYAPFVSLFPNCRAVVHHGGIGTTAKVLSTARPHLIVPMAYDQPDNARRLVSLGVGMQLKPRLFTPSSVAAQLQKLLLSDTVAVQCQERSRRIDTSSALAKACTAIESLSLRRKIGHY